MKPVIIGVIGQSTPDSVVEAWAREVGYKLAVQGFSIVTGGLTGVMEAAAAGFQEGVKSLSGQPQGVVIGLLPGASPADANPFVDVVIPTGVGEARNAILVNTAQSLIAIGHGYGTLAEIAFALKQGKRVVGLGTWEVEGIIPAKTAEEAITLLLAAAPHPA